jgi:membrane protein
MRGLLGEERQGLLSLGAILALWGGSAAFASIIDGLNIAHRVEESQPWWKVRALTIAFTLGLSVFMILAFVLAVFGGPLAKEWSPPYLRIVPLWRCGFDSQVIRHPD